MDLNLLAALDALLQEGSVIGAAARLSLSPSAMSRALTRLREATGDPILVRAGRGLVPSPRAIEMRRAVEIAHGEVRRILCPPEAAEPSDFRRVLTIRGEDAVTAMLAPALLERARTSAPGVTIVFCAEGDEDVGDLRDGTVDLDIGVQGPLAPEIRTSKLFEDRRVAILARSRGPRKPTLSLSALAALEHIDVSRRGRVRGPLDTLLERAGLSRTVRAVVPNQLAAAVAVAGTPYVSLVSGVFARRIQDTLPIRIAKLAPGLTADVISMAWHPRFDGDPPHSWLRAEIKAFAATIVRR